MKKLLKKVTKHAIKHFELLDNNWETVDISRVQAEQILKQISNVTEKLAGVVRCAHERIIGQRRVANKDKLLSIYEDDVHVIVRVKNAAAKPKRESVFSAIAFVAIRCDRKALNIVKFTWASVFCRIICGSLPE